MARRHYFKVAQGGTAGPGLVHEMECSLMSSAWIDTRLNVHVDGRVNVRLSPTPTYECSQCVWLSFVCQLTEAIARLSQYMEQLTRLARPVRVARV